MSILNPTPDQLLVDQHDRPYFLWDMDLTLEAFRTCLRDPHPGRRAYFIGKLMRQAKPDDVFRFVSLREIQSIWPLVKKYLGRSASFWTWLLESWGTEPLGDG